MIGLDFPKTAERLFSSWRPRHLAASLAVFIAGLFALDAVSPSGEWVGAAGQQAQYGDPPPEVVLRWRDRQDPRGFTTPSQTGFDASGFGLAWISGSSISVRAKEPKHFLLGQRAYELTDVFARQTETINGQKAVIHEYMVQGARSGDIRRAALHAANDPLVDAIVVSLNPVWLYNDIAVFTESNQRASVAAMYGAGIADVLTAPEFSRPSAILTAFLAKHSAFVRDRYPISRRALPPSQAKIVFPYVKNLESKKLPYAPLTTIFPRDDYEAPESMKWIAGYRATLLRQELSENGRNAQFFKLALKSLARSGKPVLLYVAPLPPEIQEDPDLLRFMERWRAFTEEMVFRYGGSNIILRADTYLGVRGERVHKDIVHLHYGQGVVDEVSAMLRSDLGLVLDQTDAGALYGNEGK